LNDVVYMIDTGFCVETRHNTIVIVFELTITHQNRKGTVRVVRTICKRRGRRRCIWATYARACVWPPAWFDGNRIRK
jgi:hypothetical protein